MRGRSQFDMAHPLAPHPAERHFHAALLADHALVLHALVLAAQALVILDRPEDAGAEQAVPLRLEGPVVDRLGLLDLTEGPRQDLLRRRDRDTNLIERLGGSRRAEDIHDVLVHSPSPGGGCAFRRARHKEFKGLNEARGASAACPETQSRYSAAVAGGSSALAASGFSFVVSSTLRPSDRISFTSTLKLSGMPASKLSSPRTIDS
jgi:hypothetical protein